MRFLSTEYERLIGQVEKYGISYAGTWLQVGEACLMRAESTVLLFTSIQIFRQVPPYFFHGEMADVGYF
jgi:hypothetical protein